MSEKIKVTFLNQAAEGFAAEMEIDANMRMDDFLYARLGEDCNLGDYAIRMNSDIVTRTTVITPDARIILSPKNVKGA